MTNRQIENRVKKIQELKAQIKELDKLIELAENEIKEDMTVKEVDEIETDNYTIRWKVIVSNRFDSASLKRDMPEVYSEFLKTSESKRFTIA